MLPTPLHVSTPQHRNIPSFTQVVKPFLNNNIFQYTNPLPFEKEDSTHTIPLLREHLDSYLYYIRYETLYIANPFSNQI